MNDLELFAQVIVRSANVVISCRFFFSRIVLKSVQHVRHACFSPVDQSLSEFVALSFSSLSSMHWDVIKMISAQHSSNNGKNWQKLRYQKILLAW